MTDHYSYRQQPLISVNNSPGNLSYNLTKQDKNTGTSFNQVFAQQLAGVKFSQHAIDRLQTRNISLGQAELNKLNDAVDKASRKGAKESLVIMSNSNLALLVSVKNKTVITAMDGVNMKDNVFTNIDSAVIV